MTIGLDTNTIVIPNKSDLTLGEKISFTIKVTTQIPTSIPTGSVIIKINNQNEFTIYDLVSGEITFSTNFLEVGNNILEATYLGDLIFSGSKNEITLFISQSPTEIKVESNFSPATYGSTIAFTAYVLSNVENVFPTGIITFYDNDIIIGTTTLNEGIGVLFIYTLRIGNHPITVSYNGDSNFLPSKSTIFEQTINQASTSISITSSNLFTVFGNFVTFTAMVSTTNDNHYTPTGTVSFNDANIILQTVPLLDGKATFTTNSLSSGTHIMTVTYNGNINFSSSKSSRLNQVISLSETTTTLFSEQNLSTYGQQVTFTAKVNTQHQLDSCKPTGSISFYNDTFLLSKINLSDQASATYKTNCLQKNKYSIKAVYEGDDNFATSISTNLIHTIEKSPTIITLSSNNSTVICDELITFSISVISPNNEHIPTGKVILSTGDGTPDQVISINNGNISYVYIYSLPGSFVVTCQYTGDENFLPSYSSIIQLIEQNQLIVPKNEVLMEELIVDDIPNDNFVEKNKIIQIDDTEKINIVTKNEDDVIININKTKIGGTFKFGNEKYENAVISNGFIYFGLKEQNSQKNNYLYTDYKFICPFTSKNCELNNFAINYNDVDKHCQIIFNCNNNDKNITFSIILYFDDHPLRPNEFDFNYINSNGSSLPDDYYVGYSSEVMEGELNDLSSLPTNGTIYCVNQKDGKIKQKLYQKWNPVMNTAYGFTIASVQLNSLALTLGTNVEIPGKYVYTLNSPNGKEIKVGDKLEPVIYNIYCTFYPDSDKYITFDQPSKSFDILDIKTIKRYSKSTKSTNVYQTDLSISSLEKTLFNKIVSITHNNGMIVQSYYTVETTDKK